MYLQAYNWVSAMLWLGVLARVVMIGWMDGLESGKVYEGTEKVCRLTQSLAGLEVLHSVLGKSFFTVRLGGMVRVVGGCVEMLLGIGVLLLALGSL